MNAILEAIKDFFGYYGGYKRPAEGALSWQHLLFVCFTLGLMIFLAIYLGKRNRNKDIKTKSKPLIVTAFLIDGCELIRITLRCIFANEPLGWLGDLPLYLCSIQFITIPVAAFAKGRVKQIALDFVFVFGLLGAVAGTIGAFQNYNAYPVLSIKNVVSGITHAGAGFAGLYIPIANLHSMKKKNIPWVFGILIAFCIVSYIVNFTLPTSDGTARNYMFLIRSDDTPYFILEGIFGAGTIAYSISVVLAFVLYIALFYGVYYYITRKHNQNINHSNHQTEISL